MLAFRINQLASPHSADGPRAVFGANSVGELAGDVVAQWKLGRMYAAGDCVKKDDLRAFEYFRGIADAHISDKPVRSIDYRCKIHPSSPVVTLANYLILN
jgi:hypothetical protein